MHNKLEPHLGGHLNKTHTDRGSLIYLKEQFNIQSMVDVGCGTGDMVDIANNRGINCCGIDGDYTLKSVWEQKHIDVRVHDFSKGPFPWDRDFDLGWSVEFVEHVEERFLPNYMATFMRCKYVVITYAPPGWPGHHHVNCQEQSYWIDQFKLYGFSWLEKQTNELRAASTMQKPFMQTRGLLFKNDS